MTNLTCTRPQSVITDFLASPYVIQFQKTELVSYDDDNPDYGEMETVTHRLKLPKVVSDVQAQKAFERAFSKKHVMLLVEEEITSNPLIMDTLHNVQVSIREWLDYPQESHTAALRRSKLRRLDDAEMSSILLGMLVCLTTFQEHTKLQQVVPQVYAKLVAICDSKIDACLNCIEILGHFSLHHLVDIETIPVLFYDNSEFHSATHTGEHYDQHDQHETVTADSDSGSEHPASNGQRNTGSLVCNVFLSEEAQAALLRVRFMPPMLVPPFEITRNSHSGYLTFDKPLFKGGDYHNDPIAYDFLNIVNQTPLSLNMDFVLAYEEEPGKSIDTLDKIANFATYQRAKYEVMSLLFVHTQQKVSMPGAMYCLHKPDFRGRHYVIGYECNYQGKPWSKAAIDLWNTEQIDVPADFLSAISAESEYDPILPAGQFDQPEVPELDNYSGFEYVLMDVANQFGKDKLLIRDRVSWALQNYGVLDALREQQGDWKEKPLFDKARMVLEDVIGGNPTGHPIGLDGVCSGMQIVSVMVGCPFGCAATGLVYTDRHPDAYTEVLNNARKVLPSIDVEDRQAIKDCTMQTLFGSSTVANKIFGEGSPEASAFHEGLYETAPGACHFLEMFRQAWQSGTKRHSWVMPDNFHVNANVRKSIETTVWPTCFPGMEIEFSYIENSPSRRGVSLIANVTHSVDGYVARSLVRRCTHMGHNSDAVHNALFLIREVLVLRTNDDVSDTPLVRTVSHDKWDKKVKTDNEKVKTYKMLFRKTGMADVGIILHLTEYNVRTLGRLHLLALRRILADMATHRPFDVLTVHDEFKANANNLNWMRHHYRNILGDLHQSRLLNSVYQDITGRTLPIEPACPQLNKLIRSSYYGIC